MEDYWKKFDELINSLILSNKPEIASELKEAQKYVNGFTDGWYEFKFAFEKSIELNKRDINKELLHLAAYLIEMLDRSLNNR